MSMWLNYLVLAPVILPLVVSASMLLLDEKRHKIKAGLSLVATLVLLAVACILLRASEDAVVIHLMGDWAAPFGIVLVADRLASTMLVLTGILGVSTLLFSLARWDRAGPRFHPLFMLLLMGVNGAFLTGDFFNLFVFFEVLLAASYGLVLHGSGNARVKAGLNYIAINLFASSLFLIGAALIYGVAGSLNMADVALRVSDIAVADRGLFHIGIVMLSMAFLIKVGMWPLGFWLPAAYSAASAPVAAVFAIMSKVGIYAILRTSLLVTDTGADAAAAPDFYNPWLLAGGVATIVYGTVMIMASLTMSRIAAACVFISSGTILAAVGIGSSAVLSGGIFYMISSTLAIAAFFLLIELLNRVRGTNAPVLAEPVFNDEYKDPFEDGVIDETQSTVVIPLALALLSSGFVLCALLLTGLPPLSSFVGKIAMMAGAFNIGIAPNVSTVIFVGVIALSSLAAIVAFTRVGIEVLWVQPDQAPPQVARVEFLSIALLLLSCVVMTAGSGPVMRHIESTVVWLHEPDNYIKSVLPDENAIIAGESGEAP